MQGSSFSGKPEDGWTKLPNGLIIEWGYGSGIIYFPKPFPNKVLSISFGGDYEMRGRYENTCFYSLTKSYVDLRGAGEYTGYYPCYYIVIGY